MGRSSLAGIGMIVGAALLGAALALALLQWETQTRLETTRYLPSPTALPAVTAASGAAGATAQASTGTPASEGAGGAALYAAKCNACHPDGKAGVGPAVRGADFAAKYPDDGALKQVIRSGRGGMPPYPATTLSDGDLNAVVAYIRGLK